MPTVVRSNRVCPSHAQIGSFVETIPVVAERAAPHTLAAVHD